MILPGFEALNVITVAVDLLSTGLNIALIIMLRGPTTSLDRRHVKFAIYFSVLSVIFAIFHALLQPFEMIFDGIGISFVASFLHGNEVACYLQTYGLSPCYMALLECAAFNFLYKYAATCSKSLHARFNDNRFVYGLSTIAVLWIVLYTYFGASFQPSTSLREKVALALNDRFETDFRNPHVCISGIDLTEQDQQEHGVGATIAMINFLSLVTSCLGTMIWCGWRIMRMIGSSKLSNRARKVHRQALRLLILQTFNPLFFVVAPALAPLFFVQARVTLPMAVSWFNAYALLLFPLLNPIIFVICTKEFRNRLLSYLISSTEASSKPPVTSVPSIHFHPPDL